MSKIVRILHVDTVGEEPGYNDYYPRGSTWTVWNVYSFEFDDGSQEFVRIGQVYDSYGDKSGFEGPEVVSQKEKQIVVWEA